MIKRRIIVLLMAIVLSVCVRCYKETGLDEEPFCDASPGWIEEEMKPLKPPKYIYLTIDDTPLNGSEYIDSIISVTQVKTSLFLVGQPVTESKRFLKYYQAFANNPHIEIYNHSYSHANNRYADYYKRPEFVLADFEKNRAEFNISQKIARLPGRNLWMVGERNRNCRQTGTTSACLLSENGYAIFGWDVEWKFNAKDCTPQQTIDELIEEIEDCYNSAKTFTPCHVVVLLHNQMFRRVNDENNLDELIEKLKAKDFIFEHLSAYEANTEVLHNLNQNVQ